MNVYDSTPKDAKNLHTTLQFYDYVWSDEKGQKSKKKVHAFKNPTRKSSERI